MFEKQRQKNPGFDFLYERAEKCLKTYPYLKDYCTYLHKNKKLEWIEKYFLRGEVFWLESLYHCEFDTCYLNIHLPELDVWQETDGVPHYLKWHLSKVYDHLGGGSQDFELNFNKWYFENYHPKLPLHKLSRGKQTLRKYELASLMMELTHGIVPSTEDDCRIAEIANAVTGEHTGGGTCSEKEMCNALKYAEDNGYTVVVQFDYPDCIHPNFGSKEHPEYKEIRELALQLLTNNLNFNDVVMTYHRGKYFKFMAFKRYEICPYGINNIIVVKDGIASWGKIMKLRQAALSSRHFSASLEKNQT